MNINENQFDNSEDTKRNEQSANTNEDIKFVPFVDFINSNNQQSMEQVSTNLNLQDVNKCLSLILNSDISTMPFIPNPYYMMKMTDPLNSTNMESTDEDQRQKGSFKNKYNFHHNYNPNFHPYYPPNFNPYPGQNFYPPYNIPPYYYTNQYGPNGINPLALLLFSSMFR